MNIKDVEKIVDERVNKISKTKSNNAKKKRELIKKIKDDNLEYYVTGGLGFILILVIGITSAMGLTQIFNNIPFVVCCILSILMIKSISLLFKGRIRLENKTFKIKKELNKLNGEDDD